MDWDAVSPLTEIIRYIIHLPGNPFKFYTQVMPCECSYAVNVGLQLPAHPISPYELVYYQHAVGVYYEFFAAVVCI